MKRYLGLLSASAVFLTGCSIWTDTVASSSKNGVSVNVHGVNYTAEPFRYAIVDPKDPTNEAGGEHIEPFAAGGIMCCFTLPKKWSPGMKVEIRSTHWLPEDPAGQLPEVKKVHTVDVPPYPDGKAGELWVLRTAEGGIDLVSSDLQPNHPQWPGKVKGWPVPSLAYQRERWELYRKLAKGNVETYQVLLSELNEDPKKRLMSAWEYDKKYSRDEVRRFTGADDPAYANYLKARYTDGLKRSQAKLDRLIKEKP